jgi:hypothetical protein
VTLRRSRVDQQGAGRKISIPYGANPEMCPVRVLQGWTDQTAITSGPPFRSINRHGKVQAGRLSTIDLARIVKKLTERASLDSGKYAGHSLLSKACHERGIAGASELARVYESDWAPLG